MRLSWRRVHEASPPDPFEGRDTVQVELGEVVIARPDTAHDGPRPMRPVVVRLWRPRRLRTLLAPAAVVAIAMTVGAGPAVAPPKQTAAQPERLTSWLTDRAEPPPEPIEVPTGGRGPASSSPTTEAAVTTAAATAPLTGGAIPETTLAAYRAAAAAMADADPACQLDWSLLAGIGRVESNHGQFGGSYPQPDGTVSPAIIGVALDGAGGLARIGDSDTGRLDGDTQLDRAVGPMQFLPGTWAGFGQDGNGDGVADPQNVYDATLAAATYLCAGPGGLSAAEDLRRAVLRYNNSSAYADLVLALAAAYAADTQIVGPPARLVPAPTVPATAPAGPASASDPSRTAVSAPVAPTWTTSAPATDSTAATSSPTSPAATSSPTSTSPAATTGAPTTSPPTTSPPTTSPPTTAATTTSSPSCTSTPSQTITPTTTATSTETRTKTRRSTTTASPTTEATPTTSPAASPCP